MLSIYSPYYSDEIIAGDSRKLLSMFCNYVRFSFVILLNPFDTDIETVVSELQIENVLIYSAMI